MPGNSRVCNKILVRAQTPTTTFRLTVENITSIPLYAKEQTKDDSCCVSAVLRDGKLWTAAAAAYNAGNAGISRRLKEQGVSGYYDLLLGEETGRYVFRIVALKEILSHPDKYGFNFNKSDLYESVPTYKIEVDSAVTDFSQFAKRFGINYKILKLHNPWLREKQLNNKSKKLYTLEIPKEGFYK